VMWEHGDSYEDSRRIVFSWILGVMWEMGNS
jgi:hypothetical protein